MATIGHHKPPFDADSNEYQRWYQRLRVKHRTSGSTLTWLEYYARAKAEAVNNLPNNASTRPPKLFGGALTPEYRRWYYNLQCEHRKLPPEQQNWNEFFAKERTIAEKNQSVATVKPYIQGKHAAPKRLFGGANTPAYREWYTDLRRRHRALRRNEKALVWTSFFARYKWAEMERQGLLEPQAVRTKPDNVVPLVPNRFTELATDTLRFDFTPDRPPHHLVTDEDNRTNNMETTDQCPSNR